MMLRPLHLALPAALLAASLAWSSPAAALDDGLNGGLGDLLELAQAAPPAAASGRTFSPKAMCLDQVARRIGNRAYIKARLELKPEQMAAWNAFEKAADDASAKSNARCATLPAEMKERPNYVDRLSMEEDAMKARVASIEAVKPTLVALYAVLSPEQKAVLDAPRGAMTGRMGGMGHHGGR
ncbi:MAG: Spy/CpxP family protein refolding chaperone [Reyranella sp.]|nr:Spy/CpxP family protein refolding chaperone [Reyranella sp.]